MSASGSRREERADGRSSKRSLSSAARKVVPLRTRRRLLRTISILFGLSLCALFGFAASGAVAFVLTPTNDSFGQWAFGLFGVDQATRYARYTSEPQAPLAIPLGDIPWTEVHAADRVVTDGRISYSGFSHLICPGLLAVVVVPSAAHCRALCVANGPPCWVFTFTPAGRCYLGANSSAGKNNVVFRGWRAEDIPGVVSGAVVVRAEGYTESPSASKLFQPRGPADMCDTHETLAPIQKLNAARFAASLDSHVLAYSSRSHMAKLVEHASAKLEQAVAAAGRAGSSQRRPQRLLLSVGIDCCKRSKVLHALTGLAFAGFDAVVQPGREHYGEQFAAAYRDLLHETRGAGYWAWKPYFLLRTLLEVAHDDDLVFYGDAGTYFKEDAWTHREAEWNFLCNHSRTTQGFRQDVLAYAEGSPEWQRTKRDLINAVLLGLGDSYGHNESRRDADTSGHNGGSLGDGHYGGLESTRDEILQSSQLSATWVIVRKSPQSIAFVNDWLSACLGACKLVGIIQFCPLCNAHPATTFCSIEKRAPIFSNTWSNALLD